jgi:HD domain
MEHCLGQTVLALRIADRIGVDERDRVATYYTGLIANVYCHADAHEQAEWFGDDILAEHGAYDPSVFEFLRMIGASERGLARVRKVAAFPLQGVTLLKSIYQTHTRLVRGLPARIAQLADLTEVAYRRHGLDAAREYVRKRRGKQLGPLLVDLFIAEAEELVADIDAVSSCWEDVIGAEPSLARLHPYLTNRMLAGVPALARSRELAANHLERLDASGYPRGIAAAQLTPGDRLLAAADVYHAMTEPRAHRPAV